NDLNNNNHYDVGEGTGGVSVTVVGGGSTRTFGSGGYSIRLNPGDYMVTFSGGALPATVSRCISIGTKNVRLNIAVNAELATEPSDLLATALALDASSTGGVDFSYKVYCAKLPTDTTVALYWASGATFANVRGGPIY